MRGDRLRGHLVAPVDWFREQSPGKYAFHWVPAMNGALLRLLSGWAGRRDLPVGPAD